jgi:hypothetical protein
MSNCPLSLSPRILQLARVHMDEVEEGGDGAMSGASE